MKKKLTLTIAFTLDESALAKIEDTVRNFHQDNETTLDEYIEKVGQCMIEEGVLYDHEPMEGETIETAVKVETL